MPNTMAFALLIFGIVSSLLFIYHELHYTRAEDVDPFSKIKQLQHRHQQALIIPTIPIDESRLPKDFKKLPRNVQQNLILAQIEERRGKETESDDKNNFQIENSPGSKEETRQPLELPPGDKKQEQNPDPQSHKATVEGTDTNAEPKEQKGELICNGKPTDSEIIYWKHVPGDDTYESPITPHHG